MKFKELLQMNKTERDEKLKELRLELIKLNAQVATGTPPKNAGQLRRLKKDIARIMLINSIDEKKHSQRQGKSQQPKSIHVSGKEAIKGKNTNKNTNKDANKNINKNTKKTTEKTK